MPDLSIFKLDNQTITIKDTTARQITNDLKTGLTSGTVKVAKATVADSASSLGKVSTYQTEIPDNGGRRKYLLMYDITDWISAKSNASTRAFDGYFISRRGYGTVDTNYTGNLSIVASYSGVYPDGSPIKSDNGYSLRLRTTSSTYVPSILHQKSNDKYYLSLMTNGSGRDLVLFGIFQGTFVGTWVQNVGQSLTPGTLPDGYELYSEGYVSIPYERAIADKNGNDITEYLAGAAYADGAFTFTRGNGSKTVLTIPDLGTALNKVTELESEISALKSDLANKLYPVGSIYMSVNATNPAELFGGTWEQIKGRFLIGTGANDANTSDYWGHEDANQFNIPAGELGGEAWHTLTVDEMPSHGHRIDQLWTESPGNNQLASGGAGYSLKLNENATTSLTGGGEPHNNMPPYLAVYMWKRTA